MTLNRMSGRTHAGSIQVLFAFASQQSLGAARKWTRVTLQRIENKSEKQRRFEPGSVPSASRTTQTALGALAGAKTALIKRLLALRTGTTRLWGPNSSLSGHVLRRVGTAPIQYSQHDVNGEYGRLTDVAFLPCVLFTVPGPLHGGVLVVDGTGAGELADGLKFYP
jgi:hypothetical protein